MWLFFSLAHKKADIILCFIVLTWSEEERIWWCYCYRCAYTFHCHCLTLEGCETWLAFSHDKNFRYITAHTIAAKLGDNWCKSLFMHIFQAVRQSHLSVAQGRKLFGMFRGLYQAKKFCLSQTPEAINDDIILWFYCIFIYHNLSKYYKKATLFIWK